MFELPVYFISDNHFNITIDSAEKERRNKFYHVIEKIKSSKGTLVIGGDFFDFWFDYNHKIPDGYKDIFKKLNQLNKHGISIHYVLGNHDFWDFGCLNKKFNAKVYKENLDFNYLLGKAQVCHGDGLLKNDTGYRLMKKIIRSNICIKLFKNLGMEYGYWLAKKISNTSAIYHHHDIKSTEIRNEMVNYAKTQWDNGFDTVLLGHYHQTGIVKENGKRLIFMGDWLRHFTVTRFDKNGWWQGSWNEF